MIGFSLTAVQCTVKMSTVHVKMYKWVQNCSLVYTLLNAMGNKFWWEEHPVCLASCQYLPSSSVLFLFSLASDVQSTLLLKS